MSKIIRPYYVPPSPWVKRRVAINLLFTAWFFGFLWFVYNIPQHPVHDDTHTDAIIVLTGGSLRLEYGAELFERGLAKKMFVSGVGKGVDAENLVQHVQKARPQSFIKVNDTTVALGHQAADTEQNASESANWIRKHDIKSIRLITSNYHMPRSLLQFTWALPDVTIVVDPVFPDNVRWEDWWKFTGTTRLFITEYHKYIGSIARHYWLVITELWNKNV